MELHINKRSTPLVLTRTGLIPTLPSPLALAVNSKTWRNTDLADGEYCINNVDNLVFWRSGGQIFTLNPSQLSTILYYNSVTAGIRAGVEALTSSGWNTIPLKILGIITPYHIGDLYSLPHVRIVTSTGGSAEPEIANMTINSFDCRIGETGTIDYLTMKIN